MDKLDYNSKRARKIRKIQEVTTTPNAYLDETEVERLDFDYSTRGPKDYVVSGPIEGRGAGPGRVFLNADRAEEWGREHFGTRYLSRIVDSEKGGRWACLIRGL